MYLLQVRYKIYTMRKANLKKLLPIFFDDSIFDSNRCVYLIFIEKTGTKKNNLGFILSSKVFHIDYLKQQAIIKWMYLSISLSAEQK